MDEGFAVWFTGLPGSGKSTLVARVSELLEADGLKAVVLESDRVREQMLVKPGYGSRDRELFYSSLLLAGEYLVRSGQNVIFDATCNRRKFREEARRRIGRFLEVYVNCPLEECMRRDPKGIYKQGVEERTGSVPGLEEPYEPPEDPEVEVDTAADEPASAAARIVEAISDRLREQSGGP